MPELARGKAGRVNGNLVALLTLMKGQPLAYNKDNQEDKEGLFDTVDTLRDTLTIFADMAGGIKVKADNMRAAALQGFATATDLADYLVKRGLPFRDAHEVVAHAVRDCEQRGCDLADLTLAELQAYNAGIGEDVHQVLTLEGSVAARSTWAAPPRARRRGSPPRAGGDGWRITPAAHPQRHDIGPGQFQGRFLLCPSPPPRTPWTPSGIRGIERPAPQAPILKRFCADAPAATWLRNVRRKPATPESAITPFSQPLASRPTGSHSFLDPDATCRPPPQPAHPPPPTKKASTFPAGISRRRPS